MQKLVMSIQKGGDGKTTTALNVAYALAKKLVQPPPRILIVDCDPQMNATEVCLGSVEPPKHSLVDVFTDEVIEYKTNDPYRNPVSVFLETHFNSKKDQSLYVLPSSPELALIEYQKSLQENSFKLREFLDKYDDYFDLAIIDPPSTLGFLMVSALKAADYAIIPSKMDAFSYSVIPPFLSVLKDVQEDLKVRGIRFLNKEEKPKLLGIFPSVIDMRLAETKYWMSEYKNTYHEFFLDKLRVNQNAPTSQALALYKTVFEHEPKARNTKQFRRLANFLWDEMTDGVRNGKIR